MIGSGHSFTAISAIFTNLSRTAAYLRHADRWPDIWNLNPALKAVRSPDELVAGDLLTMPDEVVRLDRQMAAAAGCRP